MRLTNEQHETLSHYLCTVGIKEQEPFEEFYDHIATGFEESHEQDLKRYIRNIAQPAFGGTEGMLRIVKEQNKIRKSLIWNRAKEIFLGLFGWPTILVVLASFATVYAGITLLGQRFILLFTLSIGLLFPILVVFYGIIKFYLSCKKAHLPYTSSNLNHWFLSMFHLPFVLLNVGGNLIIPLIVGRDAFKEFLNAYPLITIVFSTFIMLIGITYLKLIRERFIFKITTI